jgi:type I restriction enzyme S subunit
LALEKPSAIYAANILIEDRIDADAYNYLYIKEISKLKFSGLKLANITDFYSVEMLTGFENSKYINYTNQGIPFIRCKNIRDNYFEEDDLTYISEEVYNILKRAQLSDDDLLYTKTGSNLGQVCCVPKGMKAIASSNCCFFKKRQNKSIDSHYVSTFLNSKYGKVQTNRAQTKTGQPTIDFQRLKQFLIPIPSPEIQKYIGDKVRKAEELREEAKRLKKEAEEILNAELKLSYFSERVKDAPKMYNWIYGETIEVRIDSQYYINETNFINNEMNKKGLKLKRISEIAYVGKGFSYTSLDNKSIPYIRISDLDDLLINFDTAELVDEKTYSEKKLSQLEQCDLIFAITGATIGKVSLFYNSKHIKATLSSDTAFVRLKDKNDAAYVLLYLKSFIGQIGILKGVTGATNRHLSLEHIGDIFIPVIDNKLKQEINMRVIKSIDNIYLSKQLIKEAKQDVEDLIEGNFDMSKVKANN